MKAAPNNPKDAYKAAGTMGSARRNAHARSQPAKEPRPRATYVYIPPAEGRCLASSPIEYAVNSTATARADGKWCDTAGKRCRAPMDSRCDAAPYG